MKFPKLFLDATKTLESFNMSADEFYSQLIIGAKCSGLGETDLFCTGISCSSCPIQSYKTAKDIRAWLNSGLPNVAEKNEALMKAMEAKINNIEKQNEIIINLLQASSKLKEII